MKYITPLPSRLVGLLLAFGLSVAADHSQADPLSAAATEQARQRGATLWDVRSNGTAALPQAVRIEASAVNRWLDRADLAHLAQAVSLAGIDLSREVVIYGDAGDPRAQALYESLLPVATGKLHWLVGGVSEWQMAGLPVASFNNAGTPARLSVPQQLNLRTPVAPLQGELALADAGRRASHTLSPPAATLAHQSLPSATVPSTLASLKTPSAAR